MDDFVDRINYFQNKKKNFLFIISYDKKDFYIEEIAKIDSSKVLFSIDTGDNGVIKNFDNINISDSISLKIKDKISYKDYDSIFSKLKKEFEMGNTFLANLTFPTELEECDLLKIFFKSKAKYKLFFNNQFVVNSPETFVIIKNGEIYTYPMKGTISGLIENAEKKLLNDEKEFAEHITVVDLLRNDLGIISNRVDVTRFRYIVPVFSNNPLLQTVTEIKGTIQDSYKNNYGELLNKILPAGSVTGAPKKKTIEILNGLERSYNNYKRGFYCGVFGVVIDGNMYSSVMIRYIEKIGSKFYYKSGGGITIYSHSENEYRELFEKIYV